MKKKFSRQITPAIAAIAFIAAVGWFLAAMDSADNAARSERLEAVKRSVENDITICYSLEGAYPESLSYLTENYGLNYDSERYIVHYECFAANIRPSVTVVEKES